MLKMSRQLFSRQADATLYQVTDVVTFRNDLLCCYLRQEMWHVQCLFEGVFGQNHAMRSDSMYPGKRYRHMGRTCKDDVCGMHGVHTKQFAAAAVLQKGNIYATVELYHDLCLC